MNQFFGIHENKLDAKGRVSVPATFRATLKDGAETVSLILRPSHIEGCVEAWPLNSYGVWQRKLDELDRFDPQREVLENMLYTEARTVETDKEGRIMIPAEFVELASLKDSVNFQGKGDHFQIWEPAAGAAFRDYLRKQAPRFTQKPVVA